MVAEVQTTPIIVQGHKITFDHRPGSGETVFLIHGITTYRFIWRKIIEHLPREMNIYAIDLLGCGDSDKPLDADYSLKAQASIALDMIQDLELDKLHLVGHDVGGGVAQIMATRMPSRFKTLSLLNSIGFDYWPVQPIVTMRIPILRQLAMASLDIGIFRMIVGRGLYDQSCLTDELMELFNQPFQKRSGRKAFLRFAAHLDNHHLTDIEDDLKHLPIPTLILRGVNDVYLSENIAEKLQATLPKSKLILVNQAGHFFQEEQAELLSSYLAGHLES